MVRTANAVYVLVSVSREQKRLTQSVIHFCIQKLMPRMKTLEIDVLFESLSNDIYGDCTNYSDREMEIRVQDTLTNEELFQHCATKWYMSNSLHERNTTVIVSFGRAVRFVMIVTMRICRGKKRHLNWKKHLQRNF